MSSNFNKNEETPQPSITQYFNSDTNAEAPGASFFDQISSSRPPQQNFFDQVPPPIASFPIDSAMMTSMRNFEPTMNVITDSNVSTKPLKTVDSGLNFPVAKQAEPSIEESNVSRMFGDNNPLQTSAKNFFDLVSSGPLQPNLAGYSTIDDELSRSVANNLLASSEFPTSENGVRANEADRRRDAWIPSERTRTALIAVATSSQGNYVPDRDLLTMPGVYLQEDMKDPVTQTVSMYCGEAEASKRRVLTVQDVTQDDRGLRDLIQAGCFRAAVNLTGRLLSIYGQGIGCAGRPSKHTTHSIQLWFTRLSLLVKLRIFNLAETEAERFGDLDRPDLYFLFYPDLYGGRMGTLVPFSFRLLLAELPMYNGKHREALTRLHSVLATVRKILKNLNNDLSEDGSPAELSASDVAESKRLWSNREIRVLHSIINCAISNKNFSLAIEVLQVVCDKSVDLPLAHQRSLQSALGRLHLQLGDITSAELHFSASRSLYQQGADGTITNPDLRELVDCGLLSVAQNAFQEGLEHFQKAAEIDSGNIMVLNNIAVCQLYLGRLREALSSLENALTGNPAQGLHEAVLLNMSTLIEFESSHSKQKQLALLRMIARYKGDGVSLGCLKLD